MAAADRVSAAGTAGTGDEGVNGAGLSGAAHPGSESDGITVKLLPHFGQVALAPTADWEARTPPARQYGQMATMLGMVHQRRLRGVLPARPPQDWQGEVLMRLLDASPHGDPTRFPHRAAGTFGWGCRSGGIHCKLQVFGMQLFGRLSRDLPTRGKARPMVLDPTPTATPDETSAAHADFICG